MIIALIFILWITSMLINMISEEIAYKFIKGLGRSSGNYTLKPNTWPGWILIAKISSWVYWTITICGGLIVLFLSLSGKV